MAPWSYFRRHAITRFTVHQSAQILLDSLSTHIRTSPSRLRPHSGPLTKTKIPIGHPNNVLACAFQRRLTAKPRTGGRIPQVAGVITYEQHHWRMNGAHTLYCDDKWSGSPADVVSSIQPPDLMRYDHRQEQPTRPYQTTKHGEASKFCLSNVESPIRSNVMMHGLIEKVFASSRPPEPTDPHELGL